MEDFKVVHFLGEPFPNIQKGYHYHYDQYWQEHWHRFCIYTTIWNTATNWLLLRVFLIYISV